MKRVFVWFDDWIRTRSGKRIPYWSFTQIEGEDILDGSYHFFHEGYGRMQLYRLWYVDEENGDQNFIAEDMKRWIFTDDPAWPIVREDPKIAYEFKVF